MWVGLAVAITYGTVAVAANFVNKYAVRLFPFPSTLLLAKTLTTVIILRLMATLQVIRLPQLRSIRIQQLAPLSMCYAVHAVLVLYSLAFLSVPMYNVLKRLTPVMVLVIKGVIDRSWPDTQITMSVLLIVSGCLVAGVGDLSFDGQGYALAIFCALTQATYMLLTERATGSGGARPPPSKQLHTSGSPYGSDGKDADPRSAAPVLIIHSKRSMNERGTPDGYSTGVDGHETLHLLAHAASRGGHGGKVVGHGVSDFGVLTPTNAAPHAVTEAVGSGDWGGSVGGSLRPAIACLLSALAPFGSCCLPAAVEPEDEPPLSSTGLLYSICVIAVLPLVAACVVTGECVRAPSLLDKLRDEMGGTGFLIWCAIISVIEGLLTGCVIFCTKLNSALTTSIVGVLKGAVSSVLGFFLLGGVKFHAVNVAGITLNMAGGVWYSAVKYFRHTGGGD